MIKFFFIIACLLFLSGCQIAKESDPVTNEKLLQSSQIDFAIQDSTQIDPESSKEPLTSITTPYNESSNTLSARILLAKEDEISLYGDYVLEGMFTEMTVKSSESEAKFPWTNVINETYYPLLIIDDINNDHEEEIIIVLTTAYGTGVNIQEVHIIKKETFVEIDVENAETFIQNHAYSNINSINDKVNVTLTVGKETLERNFDKSFVTEWSDKVVFGWIIRYEVINHRLIASFAGNVSPTEFPFNVRLIYGDNLNIEYVEIYNE